MALADAEFQAFKALVDDTNHHNERECQEYLHHAVDFLLPGTPLDTMPVVEHRNYFGVTDFVVAATMLGDDNREFRAAYIWELKAPQCYLFEKDTNNRCQPTDDFLRAENQLLHYSHIAMGDQHFRSQFRVLDHTNIKIGGIIIGTKQRFLRNPAGALELENAYTALKVRELYLYKSSGIRVLTWDRILETVRSNVPG